MLLLLASGTVFFVDNLRNYIYPLLFLGVLSSLFFLRKRDFFVLKKSKISILIFILLCLSFFSSIVDVNVNLMIKALSLFFVLFYFSIQIGKIPIGVYTKLGIFVISIFIISLCTIVGCLSQGVPAMESILFGYSGIFGNPNGLGITMTLSAVVSGCLLVSYFFEKGFKGRMIILYGFVFVLSFIFVIMSASRTSLFGVLLPLTYVFFREIFSNFIRIKNITLVIIFLAIAVLFSYYIFSSDIFQMIIVSKFEKKIEGDEMLSDRDFFWSLAINYSKIIGSNTVYSETTSTSPHNTFLSFLIYYGYLFLFFFLFLYGYIIIKSYKFINSAGGNLYRYIPFAISCSTVLLFMAEQIFTSLNNFATLICFGILNGIHKDKD